MTRAINRDFTFELGGHEVICNVDITPYDPGRTSGPPEHCYPPEGGEHEITAIKLRIKPGKDESCFLEISDFLHDLDALDMFASLVYEKVEEFLTEPPEQPEPNYDPFY